MTGAIDLVADAKTLLCHPQRAAGDGQNHRHRLPAFRHDDRLCGGQPASSRLEAAAAAVCAMGLAGEIGWSRMADGRRQLHLPQPHHRRHLSAWTAKRWMEEPAMKCDKKDLLLYAVTDRALARHGRPAGGAWCEESLQGGVTMRAAAGKGAGGGGVPGGGEASMQALCRRYRVPFIINDNVDIALAMDADGVHVGQQRHGGRQTARATAGTGQDRSASPPRPWSRRVLAQQQGADYLGVGAVFPTGSKADAEDVLLRDAAGHLPGGYHPRGGHRRHLRRDNVGQAGGQRHLRRGGDQRHLRRGGHPCRPPGRCKQAHGGDAAEHDPGRDFRFGRRAAGLHGHLEGSGRPVSPPARDPARSRDWGRPSFP